VSSEKLNKLDADVAREIMGWQHFPERSDIFRWQKPSPVSGEGKVYLPYRLEPDAYSSDMNRAMEVVAKMTGELGFSNFCLAKDNGYGAQFWTVDGAGKHFVEEVVNDQNPAVAICKAALGAIRRRNEEAKAKAKAGLRRARRKPRRGLGD
jgi:hypothetical protein